ncbi:cysteine desulfurase family protein [Mucispirillum schaedleri]|uniref:cysteine desulfurase family protein n=1 Tax=Mucispirillum schaedleri TaxID=248039 RepID=UPI001F5AA128|nr:cysteine desulfurase family protein [Mucispirillum schaedleri]
MNPIYLDNIAGTKPDTRVVEAVMPYLTDKYGNPAAHFYPLGRESYSALNQARKQVADLIGAEKAESIIFTSNGTESNNIAIKGIMAASSYKKHIIISEIEHYSIQNPVLKLTNYGYTFTKLPVDKNGRISPESVANAIKEDTALVAVAHANSEIGVIQDIEALGKLCKEKGVHFHVDAVASCGFIDIDVKKMNASTLTIAAQNFYGIRGAAALYVAPEVKLVPLFDGGFQEKGIRCGSENIPAIVGLGKACEIAKNEMAEYTVKLTKLRNKLIDGLTKHYDFLHITGDRENRLPYHVSFWVEYIEGESLLMWYAQKGVYCASGSACSSNILAEDEEDLQASHVLTAVGVPTDICAGSITMSLSKYIEEEDIDHVLKVSPEIIDKLCAMSPAFDSSKIKK